MRQKMIMLTLSVVAALFSAIALQTTAVAQQTTPAAKQGVIVKAYGPGGPAPAMREAARIFGDKKGISVEIVAGPTPSWKEQAMKELWNSDSSYDVWLIWTIWQKEDPASADLINIEKENTIYRSCGIATTNRSEKKAIVTEFSDFLQSIEGQQIFAKWGWLAR